MRQLGSLPKQSDAQRFADFLLTQGVSAHVEQDGETWDIWIREEEHLDKAAEAFTTFKQQPNAAQYKSATGEAEAIRREEAQRRKQAAKNIVEIRGGGSWGSRGRRTPGVFLLIAGMVLVALMTNVDMQWRQNEMVRALMFANPMTIAKQLQQSPPPEINVFQDIARGEVWRLATPMFLHGGWFHLSMNAYMLYFFGGQIEQRRGFWRFIIFAVLTGVIANIAQAVITNYAIQNDYATMFAIPTAFGGMSGVVYATFGYVWMKAFYEHGSGFQIGNLTVVFLVVWFFLCFTGFMGPIANSAHAFGLFSGVAIGYAPQIFPGLKKLL